MTEDNKVTPIRGKSGAIETPDWATPGEDWVDVHAGKGVIEGVEISRNPHMPDLWGFKAPDQTGTINVMFTGVAEHSNPTIVRQRMSNRIQEAYNPEADLTAGSPR